MIQKIRYGTEEIFEIKIIDVMGNKAGSWKCMKSDFPEVIKILNKKYGLNMYIKTKKDDNRDLDWIV